MERNSNHLAGICQKIKETAKETRDGSHRVPNYLYNRRGTR